MHTVSGSISLPSQGFFSPFPHGTCSLSVSREYLALEDGPPMFSQDNTCPDLLIINPQPAISNTGLSPATAAFPKAFFYSMVACVYWAIPRSLATTSGISIDFFSSGYLDVSVHQVCLNNLCIQLLIICKQIGFPHSDIHGSKLVVSLPWLFADYYVLHRLLLPRHSPYALTNLFLYS